MVFGLWAVVLVAAISWGRGWETAKHYLNDTVNYTEPLFVIVIMALASTRPIVVFAERAMGKVAALGKGTPAAWWFVLLSVGPLLGSFITEPAAMTICALLLARQFYDLNPSTRLKYATLGLLFVNVSIGGTLTHFAAPPILMVARPWAWDLTYVMTHFGWRTLLAVFGSTTALLPDLPRRTARSGRAPSRARHRGPRCRCRRRRPWAPCCRCRPGSSSCTPCSWRGPWSTRTIPRCSSAGSCSSWDS